MDREHPEIPIEDLLAHQGFLASLARHLTSDEHLAADLVQDVWVAGLTGPAPRKRDPRAWLGSVLRNAWRNRQQRESERPSRERRAARSEAVDPGEAARELELRQRVLEAVRALPEPYLTAIYLRYYGEHPLGEIGRLTGVPTETARSRLQRGIELLRAKLDRGFGARGSWVLLLGAWAERPERGAGLPGGASAPAAAGLHGGWLLVGLGAAASAVLLIALGLRGSPERVEPGPTPATAAVPGEPAGDPVGVAGSPATRLPLGEATGALPEIAPAHATTAAAPAPAAPPDGHLMHRRQVLGRVLGPDGLPVEGAQVRYNNEEAVTDRDGRFELQVAVVILYRGGQALHHPWPLIAHAPGRLPAVVPAFTSTLHPDRSIPQRVELTLGGPPRVLSGRIVAPPGEPVGTWLVALRNPSIGHMGIERHIGLEFLTTGGENIRGVDGEGRFRFEGLLERPYDLTAWNPESLRHVVVEGVVAGPSEVVVEVPQGPGPRRLAGRVVSLGGAPLPNAYVTGALDVVEGGPVQGPPVRFEGPPAPVDAGGYFELFHESAALEEVVVRAPEALVRPASKSVADLDAQELERLELVVPRRCTLVLESRSAEPPGGMVCLLDAEGSRVVLKLSEEDAKAFSGQRIWYALPLWKGPGARVLETGEDAVLARFYDASGRERELRPIHLRPDAPTTLSW